MFIITGVYYSIYRLCLHPLGAYFAIGGDTFNGQTVRVNRGCPLKKTSRGFLKETVDSTCVFHCRWAWSALNNQTLPVACHDQQVQIGLRSWDKIKNLGLFTNCKPSDSVYQQGMETTWPTALWFPGSDATRHWDTGTIWIWSIVLPLELIGIFISAVHT